MCTQCNGSSSPPVSAPETQAACFAFEVLVIGSEFLTIYLLALSPPENFALLLPSYGHIQVLLAFFLVALPCKACGPADTTGVYTFLNQVVLELRFSKQMLRA